MWDSQPRAVTRRFVQAIPIAERVAVSPYGLSPLSLLLNALVGHGFRIPSELSLRNQEKLASAPLGDGFYA